MSNSSATTATVTGVSPTSGPVAGGTLITITGTGLSGATAVIFGKVQGKVISASDTQVTATTPSMPSTGTWDVRVNVPTGKTPDNPSVTFQFETAAPQNVQFVVVNKTGVPNDLVYVKFLGANIAANSLAQNYAGTVPLANGGQTSSQSYSLAEMTSQLALPALPDPVANFTLNSYSGGRIYFSLINELNSTTIPAAQNPNDPDFSTVYAYVEPSVFPTPATGSTNIDASYVDFVGIPVSIAIKNATTGALANPPANNPLTTPAGMPLFNALTSDSNVPTGTQVSASGSATSTNGTTYTISQTARILSPSLYDASMISGATPYHGWTGSGSLIDNLRANATALNVSSYVTSDQNVSVPTGTLFGFAGSTGTSIISSQWLAAQSYSMTATAVSDLNPNKANPRIPQLAGVSGIILSGSGSTVGAFSIYLTDQDLDAPTGIYGANPPYIVDWTSEPTPTAYPYNSIANDLSGRIVGDLLAGFNFGWAACTTTVAAQAQSSGTAANLTGSVFDVNTGALANTAIGQLSTGQFFYLLSLQPTTADVALWFGSNLQPSNASFYNNYASDFQSLTNAYNMAFTDRLQGSSDPDMFFSNGSTNYVEITLLPGAYTVTAS